MPITLEVVFTGLCLFCLNDEKFCDGKLDTVYLLNGTDDAKVCDRDLDGGHHPLIAFDAKYLLPGSPHPHRILPAPGGRRTVVAGLDDIELCLCEEPSDGSGCTRPRPPSSGTISGAVPIDEHLDPYQRKPVWWDEDSNSFDWIVKLRDLYPEDTYPTLSLCPQAEEDLGGNQLVRARVRLDRGTVLTPRGWNDSWGKLMPRMWRRLWALDYLVWAADPLDAKQTHFPKAMPGSALWRIDDIPSEAVVLLQDCNKARPQRTLFRLNSGGKKMQFHITNAPDHKHPLMPGADLEHFRWYYRLVDWNNDGCVELNKTRCPDDLPIPMLPEEEIDKRGAHEAVRIKGVITQTIKCPPANSG